MILNITKGDILLPDDFRFEVTSNHPFFSDEGTASTPATLPPAASNLELLDHPENGHRTRRLVKKMPAVLSHGTYSKRCQLVIDSAGKDAGISCSLALQESEMYASCQDRNLRDIFAGKMYSWANYFNNADRKSTDKHFAIIPVAADVNDNDIPTTILNKEDNSGNLIYASRRILVNGKSATVPKGYGIAPFIYLWYAIKEIFSHLGYTVSENVFETDTRLNDILLLHNCADVLVHNEASWNSLYYSHWYISDILPNITVGDFVTWLHDKFGAFVTVKDLDVRIRLFQSVSGAVADADLTPWVRSDETFSYPEPRMIDYGCENEIYSAEPAAETLEDLRKSYPVMAPASSYSLISGTGLFYVKPRGKYYLVPEAGADIERVGSDNYRYTRFLEGIEKEEISPADLFVPMIEYNNIILPYVGDTVVRFSNLDNKDAEADIKIMITRCYHRSDGAAYGSNYPCEETGADLATGAKHKLDSTTIAETYWPLWRDLLLNGAPEISCTLAIPLHALSTLDLWTPKILSGKKVLIKSLHYTLSSSGVSVCDATLQLLPQYDDAVEIQPIEFNQVFDWVRREKGKSIYSRTDYSEWKIIGNDGLPDYTDASKPSYSAKYLGEKALVRSRWQLIQFTTNMNKRPKKRTVEVFRDYYEEYFISILQSQ